MAKKKKIKQNNINIKNKKIVTMFEHELLIGGTLIYKGVGVGWGTATPML